MYASKPESRAAGLPFHFVPEKDIGSGIAADEIRIAAAARHGDRRDLARLVLQGGLDDLRCGSAATKTRIVVKDDPRLDDMLAALIAELRFEGKPLPPGLPAFAKYAAEAAAGHTLGSLPIEKSLAALYAYLRTGFGPLSDPEQAGAFSEAWAQLAAAILAASEDPDVDPFEQDIFPSWLFRREQEQLLQDRAVYLSDRRAGQRWWVRLKKENSKGKGHDFLPEQPALILSRPNSRVWRFWADSDPDAAGGIVARTMNRLRGRAVAPGFAFRGVIEQDSKHWAFSTRAGQDTKIRSLQPRLQEVEQSRSPAAKQDPWVVVERYAGTMVSGPWLGSVMPDPEILAIVGKWANARPMRWRLSWSAAGMVAAVFAAAVGVILGVVLLRPTPAAAGEIAPVRTFAPGEFALRPGGAWDRGADLTSEVAGTGPVVVSFQLMLDEAPRPPWPEGEVAVRYRINKGNEIETLPDIVLPNGNGPIPVSLKGQFYRVEGKNEVEIWVDTKFKNEKLRRPKFAKPNLTSAPDAKFKPTLYVFPIAVVDFEDMTQLKSSERDGEYVVRALMRDEVKKERFAEVIVPPLAREADGRVRCNLNREQINSTLAWLKTKAKFGDTVLVLFSSHGKIIDDSDFYIIPHSCRTATTENVINNGVSFDALKTALGKFESKVVVIVDTCYSGLGDWNKATKPKSDKDEMPRMLILTASKTEAEVKGDQSHGVLTYAFLKSIGAATAGDPPRAAPVRLKSPVSFHDLMTDVPRRYDEIVQDKKREVGIFQRNSTRELQGMYLIPP